LKVQDQITGRRVVKEGRREGENIVKTAGYFQDRANSRCQNQRPVKHERVVRAEVLGEGRAQSATERLVVEA
jgi:hypothetical protein